MSKNHSFKVVFQDEVHFQVQTSITSRWAEKGSKPKVMSKPGKESIAYSGYLIPETGELILGDIMINIDRVYSQAEEYGHSVLREFAFLTAHSLYHLCGYDHMDEESALIMEEKHERVLAALGITRE